MTFIDDFKEDVLKRYPNEACGFVVQGQYIAAPNSAENPRTDFRISALDRVRLVGDRKIEAILHSHPYDISKPPKYAANWPSQHDMESYFASNVPWGIACTEGETVSDLVWLDDDKNLNLPLEGLDFIHGINDCYSAIRRWYYQERGIKLLDFARSMEWWENGQDLYTENFGIAGFEEIPLSEATVGDILMVRIRTNVVHHAAVLTSPSQVYHHMFGRPSGFDEQWLGRWEKYIVRAVRYSK